MIRIALLAVALAALLPSSDCTFLRNPDEFLRSPEQRWRQLSERTGRVRGELQSRLDETLIVAKGEFGRTCDLNGLGGRDHYFVHSALFAGGGSRGGQALGATTEDGRNIERPGWSEDRPIGPEDIAATIYSALGIDYTTVRRDDPQGFGFEYVPSTSAGPAQPVRELFL